MKSGNSTGSSSSDGSLSPQTPCDMFEASSQSRSAEGLFELGNGFDQIRRAA